MADPRFYRNHGPFDLTTVCAKAGVDAPGNAAIMVRDLAGLAGAGPEQLAFYSGVGDFKDAFSQSKAGICLVPQKAPQKLPPAPPGTVLVPCASVQHAWAAIAALFYPDDELGFFAQERDVHETARLGDGVALGRGVTIGPNAEIGAGTRIGAGAVIGQGVAIGRTCEIGANAVVTHSYLGDEVKVLAGAVIGQSGFGFVSSAAGHVRIPQLGRVIIQDRVEIGACATIDRGALGDTVIGEGTKIDNLVHIAHNVQIGRHCLLTAQVAIAGSSEIGDFVIMGGQSGVGDHVYVGSNSRLAPRTGVITGQRLDGGQDYGGIPAKPLKEYFREIHMVSRLVSRRKREAHD